MKVVSNSERCDNVTMTRFLPNCRWKLLRISVEGQRQGHREGGREREGGG